MALSSREFLDDNIKLEPKVVLALSRLTKLKKTRRATGIACKQIVDYLNAHYSNLDGDIESQVLTALLSCIKNGIVCALENGKYMLPGPGSKGIISKCITRSIHGPKCSCSTMIKPLSKNFQNACCILKTNSSSSKKGRKLTTKSKPSSRSPRKRTGHKTRPKKFAKDANQKVEEKVSCTLKKAEEADSKCNYCFEVHPPPASVSEKLCKNWHPGGLGFGAPLGKFFPGKEIF